MGTVVLDAGVVIGWLDSSDPHHDGSLRALEEHRQHDLRLPASALAEVLVRHVRDGSVDLANERIKEAGIVVDSVAGTGAVKAAEVRARHRGVRLPDALVLGHAEAIGADVILTTDARWRSVSRFVHVV